MTRPALDDIDRRDTVEIRVSAHLPGSAPGPGTPSTVPLELVSRGARELVLPEATVRDVLQNVRQGGDGAVRDYSRRFDKVDLPLQPGA